MTLEQKQLKKKVTREQAMLVHIGEVAIQHGRTFASPVEAFREQSVHVAEDPKQFIALIRNRYDHRNQPRVESYWTQSRGTS